MDEIDAALGTPPNSPAAADCFLSESRPDVQKIHVKKGAVNHDNIYLLSLAALDQFPV